MRIECIHLVFSLTTLATLLAGYLSFEDTAYATPIFWVLFPVILVMNPVVVAQTKPWRRDIPGISTGIPPFLVRISSAWLVSGLLAVLAVLAGYAFILYAFINNQLPH